MKNWIAAIVFGIIALATPSQALVLHNNGDEPIVHPTHSVVGQWRGDASCVAIGRSDWDYTDYVITTRHQGEDVNAIVTFGGVEFKVVQQWNHSSADLRIGRLETMGGDRANLSNFTQWYDGSHETIDDDNVAIVVGGFGKGRGTSGSDGDGSYYNWSGANNNTQRWGSNTTNGTTTLGGTYTTAALIMNFGNVASKECAIAEWDSGGGWFMDVDATEPVVDWQLVGLNLSVDVMNRSYYAPSSENGNYAVHISQYATWIDSTLPSVPEPATLSLLACGAVAILKRRRKRYTSN
jgi:hypothetical protein